MRSTHFSQYLLITARLDAPDGLAHNITRAVLVLELLLLSVLLLLTIVAFWVFLLAVMLVRGGAFAGRLLLGWGVPNALRTLFVNVW